jgi:DNA helicase-2/ATP-dependent DNA helicase PcrA
MPHRPEADLSPEQSAAARHPSRLLQVIAAPGSGKTRVAAHRFGLLRFDARDGRAVIAVSFTRAATAELRARIEQRWGSGALKWPHQVTTIDELYLMLIGYLLDQGLLQWNRTRRVLNVLDTWDGTPGWGKQPVGGKAWLPGLAADRVTAVALAPVAGKRSEGFNNPSAVLEQLDRGVCTHRDIRALLRGALAIDRCRDALAAHLSASAKAVLIDEVYDGNQDEADLIELLSEADTAVVLVGDPWQAMYGFRGAEPRAIDDAANRLGFAQTYLELSHRFAPDMRRIAHRLRAGGGAILEPCDPPPADVVLSSRWSMLLHAEANVVPLSFGQPKNPRDAATLFLLDRLSRDTTHLPAIYLDEAARALDLDRSAAHSYSDRLSDCLELAVEGVGDAKQGVLLLNTVLARLGCADRHPQLRAKDVSPTTLGRLQLIAEIRSNSGLRPVPGMTVHQAKGREWPQVAVCVTPAEAHRLELGLDPDHESDRVLYVAVTRAQTEVAIGVVRASESPEWHHIRLPSR